MLRFYSSNTKWVGTRLPAASQPTRYRHTRDETRLGGADGQQISVTLLLTRRWRPGRLRPRVGTRHSSVKGRVRASKGKDRGRRKGRLCSCRRRMQQPKVRRLLPSNRSERVSELLLNSLRCRSSRPGAMDAFGRVPACTVHTRQADECPLRTAKAQPGGPQAGRGPSAE